jgi:hypothetical protein
MADESERISFSLQQVAAALVKEHGIHEGFWGVSVEFGIGAANIVIPPERGGGMLPAAIVPVKNIGLIPFNEENDLVVNAAKVNPARGGRKRKRKTKKKKAKRRR